MSDNIAMWMDGHPTYFDDEGDVELMMEDGTIVAGKFEFDDEIYDPTSGEEWLVFKFTPFDDDVCGIDYHDAVRWREFVRNE